MRPNRTRNLQPSIAKSPTGIPGLDELTGGGLPAGRPTLVCGGPGCGKTLLAMEFLIHGAMQFNEPGIFMAFEENMDELIHNVGSLGFNLRRLIAQRKIALDHVRVERNEIEETGEYDLEGLFIRIEHAVRGIRAKRIVLDTAEALFAGLPNAAIVRAELRRLFRWLKEKGLTAIITGERGEHSLTRYGLEEYVSDCVILLDHRVTDQTSTRRLRVVKYRGSVHGTNEYPFLIARDGISVWPVTSLRLDHEVSRERVSSGIPRLDFMLGGKGYYQGSTVLISGTAGTGKSSMAASFADAVCRSGKRCIYFSFEESPAQILRNMRSIGLDLQLWVKRGRLRIHSVRPTYYGLEMHLMHTIKSIDDFEPHAVVVDPISSLIAMELSTDLKATLMRLMDYLKQRRITTMMTCLTPGGSSQERTDFAISSLVDTWLVLRDMECQGERNRGLHVLKSRGMAHSNQVREFLLTHRGVQLTDVYVGPSGVLTGSARLAQEAREKAERVARRQDLELQQLLVNHKRQSIKSHIAALQADLAAEEARLNRRLTQEKQRRAIETEDRLVMGRSRHADLGHLTFHGGPEHHDGEQA